MSDSPPTPAAPVMAPDLLASQRTRRTLWLSLIEGSFTQVFMVWTSGSVLTGLMLHFGATPRQLAAVVSIPLLMQLMNPLSSWLVASISSRKRFIVASALPGRLVWLVPVILPLLGLDPVMLPLVMVGVVCFSSFFQSGLGPAWASLMADVVPEASRGRYFGFRNGLIGIVGMLSGFSAGWFLDHAPAPASFQLVMLVAVVFAMVGIRLCGSHYEPQLTRPEMSLLQAIGEPFRDENFRRFLRFAVYWTAAVMLAAPFVIPYFLTVLKMSFTQLAVWSAITSVSSLVIGSWWGRIADRVGHKQVLKVTTFIAGTAHPACWMLATPGNLTFIWISGLMDALSWSGINAAMFNLSLVTAPRQKRMIYLAVIGAVSGVTGFCSGIFSGWLLEFLLRHEAFLGSFHWTGYHSLFALSALLRMQAWWLLGPVREARAMPAREILRWLWLRTCNRLPWRTT